MGKSRAEIQKAYRVRLKEKNNEDYLKKERDRNRRNYVPSASLSDNDRKRRNQKNREKLRRFYNRKREERVRNNIGDTETSGYESEQGCNTNERGRLTVRLPFQNNRRKGALLRWRRELSEATSRIRLMEQERKKLVTKYRTTQRALQRMRTKTTRREGQAETPRKQTEAMMDDAELTTNQRQKIRKSLLLGNVMVGELKAAKEKTAKGSMKSLHRVISGKIVKKYRCTALLAKKTGFSRHGLSRCKNKEHQLKKQTRKCIVRRYQDRVLDFMKREDNSKLQPGKADATRIKKGEKVQTYVLTDYLKNLYNKYKSENPTDKISLTSFCRSRPRYILTTSYSSASSCLCTKHQNAAITVKTLRRAGIDIPTNPEKVLDQMPSAETMNQTLGETVVLGQWTRVEVEEKGKKKYVTKIVESNLEKENMLAHFEKQMSEFKGHVKRVATQYEEIKKLKKHLPKHEMIVQLDFAENYSCRSVAEVQSAYFNQTSVTLHPVVGYYRENDGTLQHKSFIIISDEMGHKSSTVMAFIDELIPLLKDMDENLTTIHYWSDWPTSQYRNKHIFDMVANHEELYGIKARWNYFEAGHGKGPCDGLGGTCKRLADEAMRSGKVVIQDADGFYNWAIQSSMVNVNFRFVSTKKCEAVQQEIEKKPIKPIKGTMKIHAVVGLGELKVKTREVSCYCDVCLTGQTCDTWVVEWTRNTKPVRTDKSEETRIPEGSDKMSEKQSSSVSNEQDCTLNVGTNKSNTPETQKPEYNIGDDVAAVYEGRWYIGKIVEKDQEEYQISFMESKKELFQWPRNEDVIWLDEESVLCKINTPEGTGKSKRMFKLIDTDRENIQKIFNSK